MRFYLYYYCDNYRSALTNIFSYKLVQMLHIVRGLKGLPKRVVCYITAVDLNLTETLKSFLPP